MPPPPPLFGQEKDDTCALACLRMILARHGMNIPEATLEAQTNKQAGGVYIEDLRNLAGQYGFDAEVRRLDIPLIADLLDQGIFPIVYLNRVHFDRRHPLPRSVALRAAVVHAVVPIRFSSQFVIVNDPLPGIQRRISKRRFEAAQRDLGQWCVVCKLRSQQS